jgi:hypothetical protein
MDRMDAMDVMDVMDDAPGGHLGKSADHRPRARRPSPLLLFSRPPPLS